MRKELILLGLLMLAVPLWAGDDISVVGTIWNQENNKAVLAPDITGSVDLSNASNVIMSNITTTGNLKVAGTADIGGAVTIGGNLTAAGTQAFSAMTTIFGDYSAINNMNQIICDATAGEIDIHIISASGVKGRIGNAKKIDVSVNDCIIEPAGAETIDGAANYAVSSQWENITYFTDSTNLLIQ